MSQARPDASQVADRLHRPRNASDAFLTAVRRAMLRIGKTTCEAEPDPGILTACAGLSQPLSKVAG